MFVPRSRGGLGVIKRTRSNPSPTSPITLYIFDQPGFSVRGTTFIYRGPYTWNLTPFLHEKDDRMSVDILIKMDGIAPGKYLRTQFSFQQPGTEKMTFQITFDSIRNSFFFRRALTIGKVTNMEGNVGCHYTHYRFLRRRDDDEPLEMVDDGTPPWQPKLPLVWERKNGAWRFEDTTDTFQSGIDALEEGYHHFFYYLFLEHMLPLDAPPKPSPQFWPKHNVMGRWKHGREINVDANYFLPTWTTVREFMKNVHLLSESDFNDLVDVLGHYYHAWEFNITDHRLMELVRAAEKFGFYDFPQYLHTRGNFRSFATSIKSVLMVSQVKKSKEDHVILSRASVETNKFTTRIIYHFANDQTPAFHIFRAANDSTWTVSYEVNTYCDVDYFSVYLMINAKFAPDEVQMWRVEIAPQKKSSKLLPRTFSRLFSSVQRTVAFPVCYYWKDVQEAIGKTQGLDMTLTLTRSNFKGYAIYDLLDETPATGIINGEIWSPCGSTTGVNLDFIRASCGNPFPVNPVNPNNTKRIINTQHKHHDVLHFLDHLYHGSKVYTPIVWPKVHSIVQFVDCKKLFDATQRMLIRFNKTPLQRKVLEPYHKIGMEILDFYLDNYEALSIGNVDTYLEENPEVPVTWDTKKYHIVEMPKK